MCPTAEYVFSVITTLLLVVGLPLALRQLNATRKATKAQVLMRLSEEWREPDLYEAVNYIHGLRQEWKSVPVGQWDALSKKWVQEHADKKPHSGDNREKKLRDEWLMRRKASQFLARMGLMMISGYLTPDDLFGVIPEMNRLIAVLRPIEIEIKKYWESKEDKEHRRIAEWDHPVAKWEFTKLWDEYQTWHKKRARKYDLVLHHDCY